MILFQNIIKILFLFSILFLNCVFISFRSQLSMSDNAGTITKSFLGQSIVDWWRYKGLSRFEKHNSNSFNLNNRINWTSLWSRLSKILIRKLCLSDLFELKFRIIKVQLYFFQRHSFFRVKIIITKNSFNSVVLISQTYIFF